MLAVYRIKITVTKFCLWDFQNTSGTSDTVCLVSGCASRLVIYRYVAIAQTLTVILLENHPEAKASINKSFSNYSLLELQSVESVAFAALWMFSIE